MGRISISNSARRAVTGYCAIKALLCCALVCSACSSKSKLYLRDELSNQGPIQLSASNPYIVGNLFVAREMQQSPVFEGFIEHRGTPDAVEVKDGFFKPLRVYLFYLNEAEGYLLEQGAGDWLVRGPEQIPNDMLRQMNKFESVGTAAPLALVESQTGRSNPSFNPDASEIRSLRPVPTREELGFRRKPELKNRGETPTTKQAPRTGKSSENTQVSEAQESPEAKTIKPRPTRTAQSQSPSAKAIRETTTTDNDSSSGDVMHRVAFAGETLRIISQWYTGDVGNTGRIARINGIEKPDELAINQAIRIPRYLLRTTEPLPQTEIPLIPKAVTPEAGPKRASTSSSRAVTPENKESQISHTDLSHTDLSHTELGQTGISQTEKSSQEDQPIDLPPRPQTIYLDDSLAEDSPVAEERSPSPSSLH